VAAGDGSCAGRQVAGVHDLGERVVPGAGDGQRGEPDPPAGTTPDGIDADDRPAEQASSQEHVQVHGRMDKVIARGGLVQASQVQGIQAAEIEDDSGGRRGQDRSRATMQDGQQDAARAGQGAQRQGDRRGQGQEPRAGHAEQQVLADVDGEEFVVAADRGQHRSGHA
jgi:hypothetical protein